MKWSFQQHQIYSTFLKWKLDMATITTTKTFVLIVTAGIKKNTLWCLQRDSIFFCLMCLFTGDWRGIMHFINLFSVCFVGCSSIVPPLLNLFWGLVFENESSHLPVFAMNRLQLRLMFLKILIKCEMLAHSLVMVMIPNCVSMEAFFSTLGDRCRAQTPFTTYFQLCSK